MNRSENLAKKGAALFKSPKNIIKLSILGALVLFISNCFWQSHAGHTYVYQNNITGDLSVYTEPGVHFRFPMFSKVTSYKQTLTISFSDDAQNVSSSNKAINVRFADTYTGQVPATFRFKLSSLDKKIIKMHREFRTFNNLVEAMIVKNARNVTVITATQYTGEEFFQGGLNQFKTKLEDQLRNGVYLTERRKVEVQQLELAPISKDQEDANKLRKQRQMVWKTVPILNEEGHIQRQSNTLEQYGIVVTQVTVEDPRPEDTLQSLLVEKKRLVAERIKTVQEQETAKAQAKTEQLKKEIERTKQVQDAQRAKELAIIAEKKLVEIEIQKAEKEKVQKNKEKDLAEIEKKKELAIAEAEKAIQKANALAATYKSEALLKVGKAKADVLAAEYAAKGRFKEIYISEIQKDIAQVLYENLKDFQIKMPDNYISSTGGLQSNLDVLSAYGALGIMDNFKGKGKKSGENREANQ